MSWIERTTKKRIKELDERPELNSHDFEEQGNKMMKDIKFYVLVILLVCTSFSALVSMESSGN